MEAASKPWTLRWREVSQCRSCGRQTFWLAGCTCIECYRNPDIRRDYLNQGATKLLKFPRYRTQFYTAAPTKITPHKIEIAEETCVPIVSYVKPEYPNPYILRTLQLRDERDRKRLEVRKVKIIERREKSARRVVLGYPYVAVKRDEHTELMMVNSLVPPGLPGREDVCQEIMLALWEGRITLEQLKANRANIRPFVRSFTRDNYESGGYAVSLDQPMHDGRSWHDVLAAPEPDFSAL